MENRQIDNKTTKQIRIDAGVHQLLKVYASQSGMTIKALLEDYLSDLLAVDNDKIYIPKGKSSFGLKKRNESITEAEQKQGFENRPKPYHKPTKLKKKII